MAAGVGDEDLHDRSPPFGGTPKAGNIARGEVGCHGQDCASITHHPAVARTQEPGPSVRFGSGGEVRNGGSGTLASSDRPCVEVLAVPSVARNRAIWHFWTT